ncbi:MAG: glycosyl hydrolase family 57 [Leptolyngbyaceae cyanobacterium bins.349]|nr:glycosyl hydrolase family 57 [Leptolyngbyaceae cyanobacterium bins.349]
MRRSSGEACPMAPTLTPQLVNLPLLAELIDGLPNISGWEDAVTTVTRRSAPVFLTNSNVPLDQVHSACAIALHMHQPTVPAGWDGGLINNLQYMFEHQGEGDNHNAAAFAWCYSRMADFIPELVGNGANPRVMLDYSGNLLWGLRQMGRGDVLDNLKRITCDPTYQPYVEWLGTMWGHAVVPSTPIPDLKLHIQAWQHHFAAIFGWEALARVKGFSPPEMHLPNHPDTLYEFVKALNDCGYRWMMVQEHTVETLAGQPLSDKHIPHRLIARNAQGETTSIIVLIKTQGSDTKLVGQMQPYYEAKSQSAKPTLGNRSVPSLVTQIADGENGGVMMNEFPAAFKKATYEMMGQSRTTAMTGTEYLELIEAAGVQPEDLPTCQPVGQFQLWQQMAQQSGTVAEAIAAIRQTNPNFHMEGASWTNHISWVQGYDNVLTPMTRLSAQFHETFDAKLSAQPDLTRNPAYRRALLHNLVLQTSCFRYWGQGLWTDYAQRLFDQGMAALAASP